MDGVSNSFLFSSEFFQNQVDRISCIEQAIKVILHIMAMIEKNLSLWHLPVPFLVRSLPVVQDFINQPALCFLGNFFFMQKTAMASRTL
jgi:hypothetical protein